MYLTQSSAGRRRQVADADLGAAPVQAARNSGAASAPERRQRKRGVGRRRRHDDGLGLWEAEELVRRGESCGLAERKLGDRGVDERVGCRGGRGVEELGGEEDALDFHGVFFLGECGKRRRVALRDGCRTLRFGSPFICSRLRLIAVFQPPHRFICGVIILCICMARHKRHEKKKKAGWFHCPSTEGCNPRRWFFSQCVSRQEFFIVVTSWSSFLERAREREQVGLACCPSSHERASERASFLVPPLSSKRASASEWVLLAAPLLTSERAGECGEERRKRNKEAGEGERSVKGKERARSLQGFAFLCVFFPSRFYVGVWREDNKLLSAGSGVGFGREEAERREKAKSREKKTRSSRQRGVVVPEIEK